MLHFIDVRGTPKTETGQLGTAEDRSTELRQDIHRTKRLVQSQARLVECDNSVKRFPAAREQAFEIAPPAIAGARSLRLPGREFFRDGRNQAIDDNPAGCR
jgi:hypothetical protein